MKKSKFICAVCAVFVMLAASAVPFAAFAEEELNQSEYENVLSGYDLSAFDELDGDSLALLKDLDLLDFDYKKLLDFSLSDVLAVLKNMVTDSIKAPLKGCAAVIVIIMLSALFQGFKQTVESGEMASAVLTVSAIAVSLILVSEIKFTVSAGCAAIEVCANFIYAFFPAFCIIVAASGSTVAAFSTNTLLLSMAQILNFISQNIFYASFKLLFGAWHLLRHQKRIESRRTCFKFEKVFDNRNFSLLGRIYFCAFNKNRCCFKGGCNRTALNSLCHKFRGACYRKCRQRGLAFNSGVFFLDSQQRWCGGHCRRGGSVFAADFAGDVLAAVFNSLRFRFRYFRR